MSLNRAMTGTGHPAPHRDRASLAALAFCLFAAPIGWALHLLVNYSIAGYACSGAASFGVQTLTASDNLKAIFLVDLGAIVLTIVAAYVAFSLWHRTKEEKEGDANHLVHAGEGRTRFLAFCGLMTSALIGFAVAIDAIGSMVGPPC